jgi:cephalosporin hydroxylase
MLFMLSATQQLKGDVIEIGSWQGRSTIFLAKGAQVSGNGRVYAIDHFLGNPGKESQYRARRRDLSDLQGLFHDHVNLFNVAENIELMPMPSVAAAADLQSRSVRARLILIDGNHAFDAVMEDFKVLRPMLLPQGLVLFDDFSRAFPGVVKCVEELVDRNLICPLFSYGNCFAGRYVGSDRDES